MKAEYLKEFKPIQMVGDVKKADEPDEDIDGFTLASQPRPLLTVAKVALQLLKMSTEDREAMEAVLSWGAAVKNTTTVKNALTALMKLYPLKTAHWIQYLSNSGVITEEVVKEYLGDQTVDELIVNGDYSQMQNVLALGELKGVSALMKQLKSVERCTIEEWKDCYCLLKRLNASEGEMQVFMERVKELYPFFEEYLKCNKLN